MKHSRTFIALLRGINVGGHNKIAMKNLATWCLHAGCKNVRTYIQSGNVVLESTLDAVALATRLEGTIAKHYGKRIPVIVRSVEEMRDIVEHNPFPDADRAKVGVIFFAKNLPSTHRSFRPGGPEEVVMRPREVHIYYPLGMGRSTLRLPKQFEEGTMRNLNTVSKLLALTG